MRRYMPNVRRTALQEMICLADRNNGKLPSSFEPHYIKWAYEEHREIKGLNIPRIPWNRGTKGKVIKL